MMFGSVRTRSRKFVQVLVLASLSTTLCSGAYAAPGAAKAGKDPVIELFQSANKLYGEKKYDAALLLFREAYGKSQSPNAHLMIGKCLLARGDLPAAYEEFSATFREAAKRAETEPKYIDTRDAASSEVAALETKIGKVVITVVDATPSTRVLMNSVEVNKDKLGTPMAVMPGTLEIVAENLAKGKASQTEEVKAGETKTVLLKVVDATPSPDSTLNPTTPGETTGGGVRKAGFAVLGVGVVGMGLLAIGGTQANSRFATLEKECGGTRCTDPKYADVVESGKTMELLANVGLGLGIAGIVAGTVMVIVGGPKPKPKTTETSVVIGPGQTMFTLKHSF